MIFLFDFWDVLARKNMSFSKALKKHFSLEGVDDFYKRYERSMQLEEWDSMDSMAASFLHEFGIEATKRHVTYVRKAQEDVLSLATPIPGMRRALAKLKADGHTLAVLSNTTLYESELLEAWGFAELFAERVFSWQTGFLKPAKESFLSACERLGVSPRDCWFVDDNKENCKAAQKSGMRAYQFVDEPSFEEFLRGL